jgi:hypothetical protein
MTEMTDRRMPEDLGSAQRENDECGAIAAARYVTAPPYAGWMRMLSADLQPHARQRRLVGGVLERQRV